MELLMIRGVDHPYTDEELSSATHVSLQSPMYGPFCGTMNIFIERKQLSLFMEEWSRFDNPSNKEYAMNIHIEPNWACPATPLVSIDCRCQLRQSCKPLLDWLGSWGEFYWEPEEGMRPHETANLWLKSDGTVDSYEFYDSEGA